MLNLEPNRLEPLREIGRAGRLRGDDEQLSSAVWQDRRPQQGCLQVYEKVAEPERIRPADERGDECDVAKMIGW